MYTVESLLATEFKDFELHPVIDISQPILYVMNCNDCLYYVYVMRDKTLITKDKKKAYALDLYLSVTIEEEIRSLLSGQITLLDALKTYDAYRISALANKIFPMSYLDNIEHLLKCLPVDNLYLDDSIPNKVDIYELSQQIGGGRPLAQDS